MTQNSQDYVSVIGFSLIQPVIALVEKLESSAVVEPNEVQTGQRENGYSSAVVALSVLLLESALHRTRYLRKDGSSEEISVAEYFRRISPDQNLALDVDEIFAIRDAIVHNHLWEANLYWNNSGALKFASPPKLLRGYGNRRLRRVMDPKTRLSRRLKINLFPSRIWRRDAYLVFKTVGRTLATLEAMDRAYFYISKRHFKFKGRLVRLSGVLDALPY
jgi:hypothetical protein